MRAVVQRVESCSVTVDAVLKSRIGSGLLVYLGIARDDTESDVAWIVEKICSVRIFPDDEYKMNLSLTDVRGELMVVSQFTLLGDARKGRRPSYSEAATPETARPLYERCLEEFRKKLASVEQGEFQAMMDVSYVNKGPVTILLDSKKNF